MPYALFFKKVKHLETEYEKLLGRRDFGGYQTKDTRGKCRKGQNRINQNKQELRGPMDL